MFPKYFCLKLMITWRHIFNLEYMNWTTFVEDSLVLANRPIGWEKSLNQQHFSGKIKENCKQSLRNSKYHIWTLTYNRNRRLMSATGFRHGMQVNERSDGRSEVVLTMFYIKPNFCTRLQFANRGPVKCVLQKFRKM